jgi:hypothetical protein
VAAVADERLVTTGGLSIPAGTRTATLSFWQSYAFELDFDGGVLEISNNGGASWIDAAPYIAAGAYNGTLSTRYGNPLAGRQAWTGNSHGYVPVTVDLRAFAGQTILLRFRAGMDLSNAEAGWLIDDVTLAIQSCAGTPPNGCQLPFTDVPASQPFYPYIHCLACYGIVAGYQDGTYRPGANVTRGQLAKIIANGAGFGETPAGQTFMDVPPGSPFWAFVERLALHNAIGGYTCGGPGEPCDGSGRSYFRPGANATRGQIAKIISGAAGIADAVPAGQQTFADVPPSQPFWPFIERLATRGIIGGYTCGGPGEPCGSPARPYFRPSNATTRGQMAKIAGNTFFPGCYIGLRQ